MAVPRPVWCPKCGTERETKANQGVTLACIACGARYRIPANPTPPSNTGGVTIEHGTAVIPQAARPRPRSTETPTAPPAPVEPAPVTNPEGVTGDVQYLKETGRRGGLANYVRTRRHG